MTTLELQQRLPKIREQVNGATPGVEEGGYGGRCLYWAVHGFNNLIVDYPKRFSLIHFDRLVIDCDPRDPQGLFIMGHLLEGMSCIGHVAIIEHETWKIIDFSFDDVPRAIQGLRLKWRQKIDLPRVFCGHSSPIFNYMAPRLVKKEDLAEWFSGDLSLKGLSFMSNGVIRPIETSGERP